jgi:hypothetical protein
MTKVIKLLIWSALLSVALLFTACSKNDSSTPASENNSYSAPTLTKDTVIKLPGEITTKENNGNYNLVSLITAASIVNSYTNGLSSFFIYNQSDMNGWASTKNSDGSTSYSFSYLQYAVKLTYYSSSNDSWWKYEYDSASYSYLLYYIEDKGSSGETDWYSQSYYNSTSVLATKDVWTKSGGTINSTFNIYNSDGTTISSQYVSTSNTDMSGTLKIYVQNGDSGTLVLEWYYVWDSSGSGTYTYYYSDGITVNTTGSF